MIYIVHGEDYAKSRKLVLNQYKKLPETNKIDVKISDLSPAKLLEVCGTQSLFGEKTFVVCEITSSVKDANYIETLKKLPENTTLVLLAPTKLSDSNIFIKSAKDLAAKIVENTLDKNSNIFKLIDSTFEQNRNQSYKEYEKLIKEGENDYYLFTMLLYGLRNITQVKFDSPKSTKMNSFLANKAKKQGLKYTAQRIKELFNIFYQLEKDIKIGNISDNIALTYIIEEILSCHEKKDIPKRL